MAGVGDASPLSKKVRECHPPRPCPITPLIYTLNSTSIGSAFLASLAIVTNRQTDSDTHTPRNPGNNRPLLMLKFCYLGDMLSVDGDADAAVEARIRIGWNKFR